MRHTLCCFGALSNEQQIQPQAKQLSRTNHKKRIAENKNKANSAPEGGNEGENVIGSC